MTGTVVLRDRSRLIQRDRTARAVVFRGRGQGPRGVAGPAGSALTAASWTTSGTAGARTNNAILANDVVLAMPASPADRDAIEVFVPQAYTGIELDGNGATIDAAASITLPLTPCSLKLVYLEAEDNWFIFSMYTGQNAA